MKQAAGTVVVTGASSGIGRELAIRLAAPGKEVWLIGRNEERLAETAAAVAAKGGIPRPASLDLSDIGAAGRFLEETFPEDRVPEAVYLAAAVTMFGEVKDTRLSDWDVLYRTNLLSPVQWAHHFYRGMAGRRSGRIVLISSLAGYAGYPTAVTYATMKAGLLGLFRSLNPEGKLNGVSVHLVSPGYVRTKIYEQAIFRGTSYERTMETIVSTGFKMAEPDAMAAGIVKRVERGEEDFALPGYASMLKWVAPRFPSLVARIHAKMMKQFLGLGES